MLLALAALALPGYIAARAYREERRCFISVPRPPRYSLADFALEGLQEVRFPGPAGTTLSGVFLAPKANGATVVLTHGSNGERSDLRPEAQLLGGAGFGVLAFDWPGHGGSTGDIQWGAPERAALSAALDWLPTQPGVDGDRLGAFGFSMGGYILIQAAARDTRLRAVAVASAPHDAIEHLTWEYRRFGVLTRWPALLALRVSGMRTDELVPERVVGQIAPRALLLIGGREDRIVPNWMTQRLYGAARKPKRLLLVPHAGHGGYAQADPSGYPQTLLEFFEPLRH